MEPRSEACEQALDEASMLAFWRARLDEDERIARAAAAGPWRVDNADYAEAVYDADGTAVIGGGRGGGEISVFDSTEDALHIVRQDPARALREVDAARKRLVALSDAIEAGHDSYDLASALLPYELLPYVDHPDYKESWRP